ncbi:helix-turn-helix domain-containing protein [Chryseobacterium sp. SIMBA_029]|uniref:helix-turn-helix domain-containing protein n=1 Tax=Chryseobacterium sp. SIMBA_029 TaxID=3085772 RepID=UPI003979DD09
MFRYDEYYVPNSLSFLIKKLWTLNNQDNPQCINNKSALPNGCFNIAFIIGRGVTIKNKNGKTHLTEGVYFCGQMTELLEIDIYPHSKATMVQLYPWTPVHFSAEDMSMHLDRFIKMDQFDISSLIQLGNTENSHICRAVVAAFSPLFHINLTVSLLTKATQMIISSNGSLNISKLSANLGCSQRHLQKIFRKHIGLSPKRFANIIKLREAVDDLAFRDKKNGTLTTLALTNNFYDQPHFNNSFQAIVKTSPNEFDGTDCFLSFKK